VWIPNDSTSVTIHVDYSMLGLMKSSTSQLENTVADLLSRFHIRSFPVDGMSLEYRRPLEQRKPN
jgi:hypothetical protein